MESKSRRVRTPWRALVWIGVITPAVAAVLVVGYGLTLTDRQLAAVTTNLLVASAALVVGLLLGFLFGIPRALQSQEPGNVGQGIDSGVRSYAVNTNLEQISDWLTKILVGVGLIQFKSIASEFHRLTVTVSPTFGGGSSADVMAAASLILFATWGFLTGYLLTRTYLTAAFRAFDVEAIVTRVAEEAAETATENAEQRAQERAQADLRALDLGYRQLQEGDVEEDELVSALSASSPAVRSQLFHTAKQQNAANWDWRRLDTTDPREATRRRLRHSRVIPVFKALSRIEPQDARFHANYAYGLKDQQYPEYDLAERELNIAVNLGDASGTRNGYVYLNRALVRIRRNQGGEMLTGEQVALIDADLALASAQSPTLASIVERDPDISAWRASRSSD